MFNLNSQSGVTLLESMIALFIFAVGALGLAAMQLTAITGSGDSQQRSLAIWKAQEIADRIRANPDLTATYVSRLGNSALTTLGVDSNSGVVNCGTGIWTTPTVKCADSYSGNGSVCTDDDDKVNYDLWEVFCDPNTGAATVGDTVQEGSAGLANLEIFLRRNTVAADGNNDMEIILEWLSREAEATENITDGSTAVKVKTDLCGRDDINIDSRLDAYCLRFRP